MDPISAAFTGVQILGAAWSLGARAKRFRDTHKAIGELVHRALAVAVCPDHPDDLTALAAATAIQHRLRDTQIRADSARKPNRVALAWKRAQLRLHINKAPKVALFGESTFYGLLAHWLKDALKEIKPGDPTATALEQVSCRDRGLHADPTPDVLSVYFVATFSDALQNTQGSAWRTQLLTSLRAADENRAWQATQLPWIRLILGPTAVAGGAFVASHLAGATDYESLIGALTALGITVPVQLREAWSRRPVVRDPAREAVRGAVTSWFDDCGYALTGRADGTVSSPPSVWIAQLRDSGQLLLVPDPLIDHLARLIDQAKSTGEPDLALQLLRLENALRRARYNLAALEDALCAFDTLATTLFPNAA
jgi:hypothetical protein